LRNRSVVLLALRERWENS